MNNLREDERISIALRELYQCYGYQPYKVNKFEEYDLYMRNKSFLMSEQVLAFSDMDGRLMALKPDVTLSIVKNLREEGETRKVFYAENVYRVPRGGYGFKEIMQTGLEVIGRVDVLAMGEVLMLAAKSLETISDCFALDVADLRIVSAIFEDAGLNEAQGAQMLSLISERNLHGLTALCRAWSLEKRTQDALAALITVYGPLEETLEQYERMDLPAACAPALCELRALMHMLRACGVTGVNLDFSVVSDMNYYSGLVFSGFIDGVPAGVLSGGRYDYLMEKMGRRGQAIGFAVYLDQLERLAAKKPEYDVDLLICYDEQADPCAVLAAAKEAVQRGERVRVQRAAETALRYRRMIRFGSGEAE